MGELNSDIGVAESRQSTKRDLMGNVTMVQPFRTGLSHLFFVGIPRPAALPHLHQNTPHISHFLPYM